MSMHVSKHALSALFLTYAVAGAAAQDRMTSDSDQRQQSAGPGHGGMMTDNAPTGMMGRGMMRGGMMGRGMMGGGRDGHGIMFRMVFALMDGDGDGTISLTEFQAAHDRIFRAMDANKDGRLSEEEMQTFMHGRRSTGEQ